jgi:hypothetical protein
MASYHNSKAKKRNRKFKLFSVKRAIDWVSRSFDGMRIGIDYPIEIHTLCGNSLEFEAQVLKYAKEVNGLNSFDFNCYVNDKEREEYSDANKNRIDSGLFDIDLYHDTFRAKHISEICAIVDLDSCSCFTEKFSLEILKIIEKEPCLLMVTVILDGVRKRPDYFPENMTLEDTKNPDEIGLWMEATSKSHIGGTNALKYLGHQTYRNAGSPYKMATIIMGCRKSFFRPNKTIKDMSKKTNEKDTVNKLDEKIKRFAVSLMKQGHSSKDVAEALKRNPNQVRAYKAWLHPSLASKRKN